MIKLGGVIFEFPLILCTNKITYNLKLLTKTEKKIMFF